MAEDKKINKDLPIAVRVGLRWCWFNI